MSTPVPTQPPPLHGLRLLLGSVALSTATFMNVLDTSIANVSIPAIAGDLGVSPNQGTWVITSFAVANGIALPLTGWLAQRFGPVRLFTISVLLFTVASWLCGLAGSIQQLIALRVLQGAVAGPMIPLSQSLLLGSFEKQHSGTALAIWSITSLVAPVVGPVMGGWITDNINWEWIFYINVPVGLLAATVTWGIYREREAPTRKLPVDAVGLALLVTWIGAFQIMLDKGKELDWFESGEIVTLAIVAAVGFVVFLVWELTEEHPVVDLSLFRLRNFWTGTLTIALGYSAFFGNVVLLPLWLQQHMGYTPTLAGLAMAPVGLLAIVLSPIVGKNVARVDARIFATTGFLLFALVLWMRAQFNTQADFLTILWPTLLQGGAIAFFFIPLFNLALSGVPVEKTASATGLMNFLRITAGAFGASVVTTAWEDRAALHHAQLVEHIDVTNGALLATGQTLDAQAWTQPEILLAVNRVIDREAFMLAANDVFTASAVLFVLLALVIWWARPEPAVAH
ncbi:MAG: DHA2 family efflux MFS transporter permease subunit [Gammaproteobacteria bacterium]|nr:DHA2 family efflux MFS transporter permease subunit [Gammaproteobacteria bacterium]MCP5199167.1 DHA2 family efflux MFS transporter permease subunit [Gammaproteobacteria bacterium]